ncbi:HAMP domain-containing sensor histidine kinase [soil metagenome]
MSSFRRIWRRVRPSGSSAKFGFRRQIIVLSALISILAAFVLVLTVQLILGGLSTRTADQVLVDRADSLAASVRSASRGKALTVPNSVLDVGVAVYDSKGALVVGRPPEHLAGVYGRLSTSIPTTVGNREESYRVLARTLTTRGGVPARAVLAERLGPYEQTERYALFLCVGAGLLLVGAATSVAAWASHRVLKPVSEMARTAEDWSEHDLSRRFALGPPGNEITTLGATLDGLLEKVAQAIRAEQRLTGELAHELRTPLTVIRGNAELMAQRSDLTLEAQDDLSEISNASRRMTETITSLLDLARRRGADGHTDVAVVEVVTEALDQLPSADRARVRLGSVPEHSRTSMPTTLAARALLPVLENATRFGTLVKVELEGTSEQWLIHIDDDGPGLEAENAESAFTPGFTTGDGAGLGLSLARRIARSSGGDVLTASPPPHSSTRFTVALPAATPAPPVHQ